jgi:hypothetical protein
MERARDTVEPKKTELKTCIAVIAIGEKCLQPYNRYIRQRFENYAMTHNYEMKFTDRVIRDLPGKQFTWQKLCLHDMSWFSDFDQIAYLDSDIFIAADAPPLPVIEAHKIGLVPDNGEPFQFNSGVLIFKPDASIADVFEESLKDGDYKWDQKALTRVLMARNMAVRIDSKFNRLVYIRNQSIVSTLFGRHWFYHALGGKSKLPIINALLAMQGR